MWGGREGESWRCLCTLENVSPRALYSVDWDRSGTLIAAAGGDNHVYILSQTPCCGEEDGGQDWKVVLIHENAHASDINAIRWHPSEGGCALMYALLKVGWPT